MSNHNINATELLNAVILASGEGWDVLANPIMLDYAKKHPTKFINSVEEHTGVDIRACRVSTRVNVVLRHHGPHKIHCIKMIRYFMGLGLADAKRASEVGDFKMTANRREISVDEVMTRKDSTRLLEALRYYWVQEMLCPIEEFPEFSVEVAPR